jgi:hypothetical protein
LSIVAFHSLTASTKDEETDFPVTEVTEVVAPGTNPSSTAGVWDVITDVDEFHALRRRRTISIPGGDGQVSYDNIRYTFPGLLMGWDASANYIAAQGRTYPFFRPTLRQEFTKIVPARLTTSYSADVEEPPTLFNFVQEDLRYEGILFSISERNLLFNSGSLSFSTNGDDTYWGGGLNETFTYDETVPSVSSYLSMVGDLKVVGHTSVPWKYNLYRHVKTEVVLE